MSRISLKKGDKRHATDIYIHIYAYYQHSLILDPEQLRFAIRDSLVFIHTWKKSLSLPPGG